jgi:chromosome segregation ATPase
MKPVVSSVVMIDTLESRTFLSASPAAMAAAPGADSAGAIRVELKQPRAPAAISDADRAALREAIRTARAAVKTALDSVAEQLAPYREQVTEFLQSIRGELKAARDVARSYRPTIIEDLKAIWESRNDPEALDAAKAKLKSDRDALKAELEPIQDSIASHRDDLKDVRQQIKDIIANDPDVQTAKQALRDARQAFWDAVHNAQNDDEA